MMHIELFRSELKILMDQYTGKEVGVYFNLLIFESGALSKDSEDEWLKWMKSHINLTPSLINLYPASTQVYELIIPVDKVTDAVTSNWKWKQLQYAIYYKYGLRIDKHRDYYLPKQRYRITFKPICLMPSRSLTRWVKSLLKDKHVRKDSKRRN